MGLNCDNITGYAMRAHLVEFNKHVLSLLGLDNDSIEILTDASDSQGLRGETLEAYQDILGLKYHRIEGEDDWISVPIRWLLNDPKACLWAIGHVESAKNQYLSTRGILNYEEFTFLSYSYFC